MALSQDITLGTDVYALSVQRQNGSVRSVASRALTEPLTLTISHEVAKNGKVSSVVIVEDSKLVPMDASCSNTPILDPVKAMFKIQYNPNVGRTDLDAAVLAVRDALDAFVSDNTIYDKFINRES